MLPDFDTNETSPEVVSLSSLRTNDYQNDFDVTSDEMNDTELTEATLKFNKSFKTEGITIKPINNFPPKEVKKESKAKSEPSKNDFILNDRLQQQKNDKLDQQTRTKKFPKTIKQEAEYLLSKETEGSAPLLPEPPASILNP